MRPHCWVMVALAGTMSYLSPERALGAPQREGERRRGGGQEKEEEEGDWKPVRDAGERSREGGCSQ